MKKLIITFILFWAIAAYAIELQGVRATVELVTGAKQTAQFLGIQNDTVSLGGSIKGQFTIVRIPANRFKNITDEQGNDLLHPSTKGESDSVSTDTTTRATVAQDSSSTDTTFQDSTNQDTAASVAAAIPTYLDSVEGKHIYIPLERRSSDSTLAEQLNNLITRLIKESGTPIVLASPEAFANCSDATCIRDSLSAHKAASAYTGRITAARTPDSLTVQASHFIFEDSTVKHPITSTQVNLSAIRPLSDAMENNKLENFVKILQGEKVTQVKPTKGGKSYIHVETDPEGANITIHGKEDICKSPCTFATLDTGKMVLYAYWNVNRQLWSSKSSLRPIPGDTTKISLKLKKAKPELRITTTPSGAEIYAGSSPITPKSDPIGYSPNKFTIFEPGLSTVQIRKVGFRDTLVTVFAAPTEITDIDISLTPITSLQEQIAQDEWESIRKRHRIGKTLMGTSIAPFLLGALFTYLATLDYDDADAVKSELDRPASGGEKYKKKVKNNKDLVDKGDRKMIIGGSLIGAGAVLLGVGIVLNF